MARQGRTRNGDFVNNIIWIQEEPAPRRLLISWYFPRGSRGAPWAPTWVQDQVSLPNEHNLALLMDLHEAHKQEFINWKIDHLLGDNNHWAAYQDNVDFHFNHIREYYPYRTRNAWPHLRGDWNHFHALCLQRAKKAIEVDPVGDDPVLSEWKLYYLFNYECYLAALDRPALLPTVDNTYNHLDYYRLVKVTSAECGEVYQDA